MGCSLSIWKENMRRPPVQTDDNKKTGREVISERPHCHQNLAAKVVRLPLIGQTFSVCEIPCPSTNKIYLICESPCSFEWHRDWTKIQNYFQFKKVKTKINLRMFVGHCVCQLFPLLLSTVLKTSLTNWILCKLTNLERRWCRRVWGGTRGTGCWSGSWSAAAGPPSCAPWSAPAGWGCLPL